MRDIGSYLNATSSVEPQIATTTVTGSSVDLIGYNGAYVVFYLGVGGITFNVTNFIQMRIQHSDDNSTWTAVEIGRAHV